MQDRLHEAGEIVIKQGEIPQDMFFILDGELDVLKETTTVRSNKHPTSAHSWEESRVIERTQYNIATLKKGQFFGETAIISDSTRMATVVAKTYTHLLALNKRNFLDLMVGRADQSFKEDLDSFLQSDERDRADENEEMSRRKGFPSEECVVALFSTIQAREAMNQELAKKKEMKDKHIESAKMLWQATGSTPSQRLRGLNGEQVGICASLVHDYLYAKNYIFFIFLLFLPELTGILLLLSYFFLLVYGKS
jgi:CRP-like cAMP-binding protein